MSQTYTFYRDGVPEQVERETWRWVAVYRDGTELHQFDDATGEFHQFSEIDQSRLGVFRMVHDELRPVAIPFEPTSMKLIHFYRRINLNVGTEDEQHFTVYMAGFERGGVKHLLGIMPDGEIVLADDAEVVQGA